MNSRMRDWLGTLHLNTTKVAGTLLLLTLAVAIPGLGLPQYITGPLVNALLIITVETLGVAPALWVGVAPSVVAWGSGVLPAPLLVMIPFIVAGNAILAATHGVLRRINYWLGVVIGAVLKCAWLWMAVTFVTVRPFSLQIDGAVRPVSIPPAMVAMMTWPQLATALAGGALAFGLLNALRVRRED
jgi:hypothetical protein